MAKNPENPQLSVVSGETSSISPPGYLGAHGTWLWAAIMRDYDIRDIGGITLLFEACAAMDTAETVAEAVRKDGAVVYSRTGAPKAHPGLRDELAARAFVVRTLERLGITTEAVQPPGHRRDSGRGVGWMPP
jgi:hypothetical protein